MGSLRLSRILNFRSRTLLSGRSNATPPPSSIVTQVGKFYLVMLKRRSRQAIYSSFSARSRAFNKPRTITVSPHLGANEQFYYNKDNFTNDEKKQVSANQGHWFRRNSLALKNLLQTVDGSFEQTSQLGMPAALSSDHLQHTLPCWQFKDPKHFMTQRKASLQLKPNVAMKQLPFNNRRASQTRDSSTKRASNCQETERFMNSPIGGSVLHSRHAMSSNTKHRQTLRGTNRKISTSPMMMPHKEDVDHFPEADQNESQQLSVQKQIHKGSVTFKHADAVGDVETLKHRPWYQKCRTNMRGQSQNKQPVQYKFLAQDSLAELAVSTKQRHLRSLVQRIKEQQVSEINQKLQDQQQKQYIEDPEGYCEATVKLDHRILKHFDCRKLRYDATCLLQRRQLEEIWGQKLDEVIRSKETIGSGCLEEEYPQHPIMMQMKSIIESKNNMQCADRKLIKESSIPLEVLYNKKIERVRALEFQSNKGPQPIKFQILESQNPEKAQNRLIKLQSDSAQEDLQFEIDINNQPIFIESDGENYKRSLAKDSEVYHEFDPSKVVKITELTKKYDNAMSLAIFIKQFQQLSKVVQRDPQAFLKKQEVKQKTEQETKEKVIRTLQALRQGESFQFERVHESVKPQVVEQQIRRRHHVKRGKERAKDVPFDKAEHSLTSNSSDSSCPLSSNNVNSNVNSDEEKPKPEKQRTMKRFKTIKVKDTIPDVLTPAHTEELVKLSLAKKQRLQTRTPDQAQGAFTLTQSPVKGGKEFTTDTQVNGVDKINYRLVNMTKEFIWHTRDFDYDELFCLQSIESLYVQGLSIRKAERILELVAKLTNKYQLEIIKPALDYVLMQLVTPFDNYENAVSKMSTDCKQTSVRDMSLVNFRSLQDRQPSAVHTNQASNKVHLDNGVKMARRTSLIGRLVWESDIISDYNFDRESARKKMVKMHSMFRDRRSLQNAFQDQATLFNKVYGNPDQYGRPH